MDNNKILTIGFSAGSLFDTEVVEKIYKEEGLKAYIDYLKMMDEKGECFGPGPALGLYMSFRKLKDSIPADVLDIRFGMVSRHSPNYESAPLFRSYRNLIADSSTDISISNELDYLNFTNGRDPIKYHKAQSADLVFTTDDETAKKYYAEKVAAIFIPNRGAEANMESYNKKTNKVVLVSDFDGVIGDVNSELTYQAAKLARVTEPTLDPLDVFRQNERINRDIPMELGPLGNVVKKLGSIVAYFEEKRIDGQITYDDIPYETIVVTARGGSAFERFNNTQKTHGIYVSQAHLMDGRNKNLVLQLIADDNKAANILFIDDGKIHFDRALDLKSILSGFVHNDYTSGSINMENEKKAILDRLEKNKPQDVANVSALNLKERVLKVNKP